jgi:hypothetical protein
MALKIIGVTGTEYSHGYILTATEDEVANLAGHYSGYQFCDKHKRRPQTGDSIEIAAMYRNLQSLANSKPQMEQARKILMAVADGLVLVEPVVEAVVAKAAGRELTGNIE